MYDDPAGVSHCVATPVATHLAFAIGRGAGRPAAFFQSPAFGREAPQPGSEGDYSPIPQAGQGHLARLSHGFRTLAGLSLAVPLPVVPVPCCLRTGLRAAN